MKDLMVGFVSARSALRGAQKNCLSAFFALLLTGCGQGGQSDVLSASPSASGPLQVYTVNYPLAYFAERIGGPYVEVAMPVPAAVDPAVWQPAVEELLAYQQADLIILNGAGYSRWLASASLPLGKTVDTSSAFSDRLISVQNQVLHRHGPAGEHDHGEVAFTTWLNPQLAILQASAIADALVGAAPEWRAEFERAFIELREELEALDLRAEQAFKGLAANTIVFSHPVYQYLNSRYALDGQTVNWEPDAALLAEDLAVLEKLSGGQTGIRLVLWEVEPEEVSRKLLETAGYSSVVFATLANRSTSGDYLTLMNKNIERLEIIAND